MLRYPLMLLVLVGGLFFGHDAKATVFRPFVARQRVVVRSFARPAFVPFVQRQVIVQRQFVSPFVVRPFVSPAFVSPFNVVPQNSVLLFGSPSCW